MFKSSSLWLLLRLYMDFEQQERNNQRRVGCFTYIFKKILTDATNNYVQQVFINSRSFVSWGVDMHRLTDTWRLTSSTTWLVCFSAAPTSNTSCPLWKVTRVRTAFDSLKLDVCAGHMTFGLTCDWWLLILGALQMLLHQFGRHTDHVLTFPVLDHVERL